MVSFATFTWTGHFPGQGVGVQIYLSCRVGVQTYLSCGLNRGRPGRDGLAVTGCAEERGAAVSLATATEYALMLAADPQPPAEEVRAGSGPAPAGQFGTG